MSDCETEETGETNRAARDNTCDGRRKTQKNRLSSEFRTRLQTEASLFLEVPEFPYYTM